MIETLTELFPPPIPQGPPLDGPVLLKDGRPAYLRPSSEADLPGLTRLLERSSPRSLHFRFFGGVRADEKLARRLLAPEAKDGLPQGLGLVVTVGDGPNAEIIGAGSYTPVSDEEAEVAFLVQDAYHGKGVGTLLLERLALAAEAEGFSRLIARVLPENDQMLRLFYDSGYEVVRELDGGELLISLDIKPTALSVERFEERDRLATIASLEPFFRPSSVAVIGASRDPGSIGHRLLKNLIAMGFNGPVYPVNPKADVVASIPAYPSVKDIPRPVDLAVIAVPQPVVLQVVEECAEKGVRGLVVLTAGFAETGPAGKALQDELLRRVRGHGMRMVGPNCLGILNTAPDVRLNATFAPVAPLPGGVAMSSQSGALGLAIIEYAKELGLGLSSFVSVGNKADVSGNDLIQYWESDPNTRLILLYLESFGNPRRFARLARRVARKKPILAVKSGRTSAGMKAAGSHTAALAASDVGVDALFRQAGVIRVDTLEEMFDVAALLAHQPIPRGPRVAILTNAGGPGILCADTCEAEGLQLPELSESTREGLRAFLPPTASVANPVDMVASATAEDYRRALSLLLDDENVDAVIVIFIPTGAADVEGVAESIRLGRAEAKSGREKPLLASFMGARGMGSPLAGPEEGIPSYRFPESAARALAKAVRYGEWLRRPRGVIPGFPDIDVEAARAVCQRAYEERGEGWLLPDEVERVLSAFRIPTAPTLLCRSADEAVAAAERIGFPVVVKLASATLVHKTEWNGVQLDLKSPEAVRAAYEGIRKRLAEAGREHEMAGVTVQPMIRDGIEVMIGVTEDPSFGPLIAFGLGGITVELLGDVVFRITPLTDQDAAEMVRSIRGAKLLDGFRGSPPADKQSLEEILLRLSRLVEEVPLVADMDLNPVRVFPEGQGACVLDARILIRPDARR